MTTTPRDLPEKPSQPTYYAHVDYNLGRVRIYGHTPDNTWILDGQQVDVETVPDNLRPLAVQVTQ